VATIIVPERLTGIYNGVIPPALLPKGSISDGLNIRKVSQGGGWKPRRGCALHDTGVLESGAAIKSMHYYANPFSADEHFITQINSKLVRESAQNKLPPTADPSYGTDLGVTIGSTPGFSATVGEYFFYADGTNNPIVWGGATPRIRGMFTYDASEDLFTDYSRKVTDGRDDTHGHILEAATDYVIVITEERCEGLVLDLSAVNGNAVTLTVSAWRSGSWTGVSGLSDGTEGNPSAVAIEGLSKAAACVVTWVGHGLSAGSVTISGITQAEWTALNATHTITVINNDTFSIAVDTSGYTDAYDAGTDPGVILGTKTLAQDGTISWTRSTSDDLYSYRGIQGFAYKLSWSGALSGIVELVSAECIQAATRMTNKWNGEISWVSGCRYYKAAAPEYQECLGQITNEAVSTYIDISEGPIGNFLYFKTPEPATMFMLGIVTDYGNTADAQVDQIEYWNGSSWIVISTNIEDTTLDDAGDSSFSQTGKISFDGAVATPERMTFQGDPLPGYWYRISWDAALSTDVRIYAVGYGSYPDSLPAYKGCVEFKNRLLVWGDPEFPNRLRYSARGNPFCFTGPDSGYTDAFGSLDEILCAVKFYNELIVFKKRAVWLLEGESPGTFGMLKITDKVGLASPKSVQVAEVGFPSAHRDEPMTIAIWQDVDGVYTFDGRKTKKESYPVDNYFNPEKTEVISAASIRSLQAFADPINNEYHLLLPSVELVFNYVTAEWYPAWEREIVLATGIDFRANNNRHYTYGASANGWIMQLEADTADKSTANADVAIEHKLVTRAIGYENTERFIRFTLRRLLAELKARAAGSITTKTFKDLATTGVAQATPQAMTMVNTGYDIVVPVVTMSIENIRCFQIEFSLAVADQEMEIHGFSYEISGSGLSEQ